MKKTAFNLDLAVVFAFALLTVLAQLSGATIVVPFFGACTIVFLAMLPFCSKTN